MILIPGRARPEAEVAAEVAPCVAKVTAALDAALQSTLKTTNVNEQRLGLLEVAISAARGHDELRNLFLRLRAASSEHPDLEELTLACGLFAAAHATATVAVGCDMLAETGPQPIKHTASYHIGLEWIVELIAYAGAYHRRRTV